MPRKWTKQYLRNGFIDEVKKLRTEQGYNPDEKPTYNWFRNNGFGYFLQKIRDLGYRPDEWLFEECGFNPQKKDFPCNNPETVRKVEAWFDYEDDVADRVNGTSITSERTHIRQAMRIAKEKIGTSDILELGQGDREVCFNRGEQIMRGYKQEFETNQVKYNYGKTLGKFLARMEDKNIIDHDPMTPLIEDSGWAGDSDTYTIAPSTDLVKAHFDACETRTEQMVMICLAILGWRPSDFCDPEAIESIHFDKDQPYVKFTDQRKNGPGVVPIIICKDFIKSWVRFVGTLPGNDTTLFPSGKSSDGARSEQWVRNTVKRIGSRVDKTMENGEEPTPENFRNFWYTEYSTAYAEFRRDNDFAASLQGSQSDRIAAESYNDVIHGSWFDTFETYARAKLEVPVSDLEPADEVGNIYMGEIDGDAEFDLVETARQATLDGWEGVKTILPTGFLAQIIGNVSAVTGRVVTTWVRIKHKGMTIDPELIHYPNMSFRRKVALCIGIIGYCAMVYPFVQDDIDALAAGEPTAWLPLFIASCIGIWLVDRELPEPVDIIEE